jgi:hypothetical protein
LAGETACPTFSLLRNEANFLAAKTRGLELFQSIEGAVEGSLDGGVVTEELAEVFFGLGNEADG